MYSPNIYTLFVWPSGSNTDEIDVFIPSENPTEIYATFRCDVSHIPHSFYSLNMFSDFIRSPVILSDVHM